MKSALPANVQIVLPEDTVNAYSLADEADVGLTFGSTIGLEMAMLGKPVLLASRAVYGCGSHILILRSKESLPEMLERCLHATPDREIQREAFRLAHCYMFRFELPFPAVAVSGIYEAWLTHIHPEDLAPGKDNSLDHICNFLIQGSPLSDVPSAQERSHTTADEDAFFEELAKSRRSLRNVHYERWLRLRSLGRSTADLLRHLPFGTGQALLTLGKRRWHALLTRVEARGSRGD